MGKKTRREREEKRDSYASQRGKIKRKNMLIAAGVLGVIGVIVGISAYNFTNIQSAGPGAPPGAGMLGNEHVHSSLLVRIFGDKFDFSGDAFQIKSDWIHFEARDGTTIHRHATGVTLGYMFDSLGITLDENCYQFPDGRQFCTDENYTLKYFINGDQVPSINEYVFADQDRILITYGDESEEELDRYFAELEAQTIQG